MKSSMISRPFSMETTPWLLSSIFLIISTACVVTFYDDACGICERFEFDLPIVPKHLSMFPMFDEWIEWRRTFQLRPRVLLDVRIQVHHCLVDKTLGQEISSHSHTQRQSGVLFVPIVSSLLESEFFLFWSFRLSCAYITGVCIYTYL